MIFGKVRIYCSLFIVTLALTTLPARAELTQSRDLFSLLEKKYGFIDVSTRSQLAHIQKIFERVQDAADKRSNRMPQLKVVNQPDLPWAMSLPDGNILLSLGAVYLCYRNVSQGEGDTRMAFVIGHELAHLTNNDFWDVDRYQAMVADGKPVKTRPNPVADKGVEEDPNKKRTALNKEIEADDLGFLYAAISGYPVQMLFGDADKPEDNFFLLWTKRSKGYSALHDIHPSPEEREAFLRARLNRLTESIALFRFGLRLAYFGHCEQAILLFRHFLQIFPAREVFNNLGACHLQRAQKELETVKAPAASYWLPLLFDAFSRAEPLIIGHPFLQHASSPALPPVLPDKNGNELMQAMDYLEQAAAADAAYLPARLNLATAHFYNKNLLKARSVMKDAMHIAPNNLDVVGWHALLLFLDNQENGLGKTALPLLTRLANQADAPSSLMYNYTILTRNLGKNVRSQWRRLATLPTPPPDRYARIACGLAKIWCSTVQSGQKKTFPWPLPVQPGTDLNTVDRDKLFAGWQVSHLGWLQEKQQGTAYRRGDEMEVLDQDGYVAMVVLRGAILGATQVVRKKLGKPIHVRPLAEGEIWSYDPQWSLMVRDGRVREAWVVNK